MFSPMLRGLCLAFAVSAPAAVFSHGQTNTMPERRPTPNLDLAALPPQKFQPKNFTCQMQIVSYFDDASLKAINSDLGHMKGWLRYNKLYDETLIEQFFDEGAALDEEEKLAGVRFYGLYKLENIYAAGENAGFEYLKTNPRNVLLATSAYIDHMEVLKSMLAEEHAQEIQEKFGKKLASLNHIVMTTQHLIDDQAEMGCELPLPERAPTYAPQGLR